MGAEQLAVTAQMILDSRGMPTVEATLSFGDFSATAAVPSGASTGEFEAHELRDKGPDWGGKGVSQAVENITDVLAAVVQDVGVLDQRKLDEALIAADGTPNKERLGANAILAVSLSSAKLAARLRGMKEYEYVAALYGEPHPTLLPIPMMNVLNGGKHAKNGLDIQEFMIMPIGAPTFSEAMRWGSEIYRTLGTIVDSVGVGDEGGYSVSSLRNASGVERTKEALDLLMDAIAKAGYEPGKDVALAIDAAASEFYKDGFYHMAGNEKLSSDDMIAFYSDLITHYPIVSLEDGMSEHDPVGWKLLTDAVGQSTQLVLDDLVVTNLKLFQKRGIEAGVGNAILIKLNQIGTLTETLDVMRLARQNGYATVVSHRSGETTDTTIAHLAVATRAGEIKTGAPNRSERTAKYNELLRIEHALDSKAEFGRNTSSS